jgi:2-polyprenyl-3-methyl-5-hydroxy-6-metoxy-1,4-benzoquinol methylase
MGISGLSLNSATVSFRDPAGNCAVSGGRVLRALDAPGAAELEAFLTTPLAQKLSVQGRLIPSRKLSKPEAEQAENSPEWKGLFDARSPAALFEHERIPFRSYPYEWPPEMLWEAARLTLNLAQEALASNYTLKDATPYNVLFRGSEPIFVDVPSFKPREEGEIIWRPYGQFVRTFLLPLLVNERRGLRLADIFTIHRDGLEPQEVYRMFGPFERLTPRLLNLVTIPTWLRSRARAEGERLYQARKLANAEKARFIMESVLKRLGRSLQSLAPRHRNSSDWTAYPKTHSYSPVALAGKEKFVDEVLSETRPRRLLDIGANLGHFSARAARAGASVVALDADEACVAATWRCARAEKLNILPLVMNLARPSPALGWCNRESPSFLSRAAGSFDCVLMLAVVHHLLVSDRIPLHEIMALAAELTTCWLVIEFVPPEDEKFRELSRGRGHLFDFLTLSVFEAACQVDFEIVRSQLLPETQRRLYVLRKRLTRGDDPARPTGTKSKREEVLG